MYPLSEELGMIDAVDVLRSIAIVCKGGNKFVYSWKNGPHMDISSQGIDMLTSSSCFIDASRSFALQSFPFVP